MTGTLYKLVGEKNRLDKTSYLTNATSVTGVVIKFPSSIIDPTLTLNGTAIANLWQFNYIRLDEFDRYYFIDDIISIANNLWEVHCHVDVLMSWKDEIKTNNALVTRSSNKGNPYLQDKINRVLPEYTVTKYSNLDIFKTDLTDYGGHESARNILLFVRNDSLTMQGMDATYRSNSLQRPATGCASPFFGGMIYIVDAIMLNLIIANNGSDSGIMSSIIKAIAFPFDLVDFFNYISAGLIGTTKGVKLTNYEDGTDVTELDSIDIYYVPFYYDGLIKLDISNKVAEIPFYNNYMDYEPYTEYYIHLPMLGDIKISPEDFNRDYVGMDIVFDIWTGSLTYSIFVREQFSIANGSYKNILSEQTIVGSQLVIAFDHADLANKEYVSQQAGNYVKTLGGIASIFTGIALTATGAGAGLGVGLIIGGAVSGTSGLVSVATADTMPKSSNSGASGNNTGVYNTYIDCGIYFYKKGYSSIYAYDDSDYINIIGRPANDVVAISECTGYLEVGTCHLDNVPALSQELDEITQLLQSGILM